MNATEKIDNYIINLTDWRGDILDQLRRIIHESVAGIDEEWKWDVPVFTKNGMVCAISAFKDHVKINFFKGAKLPDPHGIINGGLESKSHRSIDFSEGDEINEPALKNLVRDAVDLNNK